MTTDTTPLVTIIVPCYNTARYVGEALDSALAQTYPRCEIIAVDDGSTDDSPAILDHYAGQYPTQITVIHQPNAGAGSARMTALGIARGTFIIPLDADDRLKPDAVSMLVAYQQAHPDYAVVYGQWQNMTVDGQLGAIIDQRLNRPGEPLEGHILPMMLVSSVVPVTALINTAAMRSIDGYITDALTRAVYKATQKKHTWLQDYYVWLQLLLAGYQFGYVPQPLFDYRDTPGSLSKSRNGEYIDQAVILTVLMEDHRDAIIEGWIIGHQQREAHVGATWAATQEAIRSVSERAAALEREALEKDSALNAAQIGFAGRLRQANEQIDAQTAQLAQLQTQFQTAQAEFDQLAAIAAGREQQIADLQDQLQQIQSVQAALASLMTERDAQLQRTQTELGQLQAAAATRESTIGDLHSQLQHLQAEYAQLAAVAALRESQLAEARRGVLHQVRTFLNKPRATTR